ncbi:hypothetical protein F5Y15DRAFT_288263 [Xylariaceae sp. FL0016]|nr:hypothetical protein F5Y15DRAFT_288263 [Xylariaceae sp. FL0016]
MSGVKNLRAMFENKGNDNNPPDRGRSPGPGFPGSPSPSDSPRPLSKVRTSFVAVEGKDGRIGLKREDSRESVSVSSRRFSDETEATTPQPTSEKTDPFTDNMASNAAAFRTNLSNDPIPESPIQDQPPKLSPKKNVKTPELAPNANPDKITDEEEQNAKMVPGDPTEAATTKVAGSIHTGIGDSLESKSASEVRPKTTATPKTAPKTIAPLSATTKTTSRAPKSSMAVKSPVTTKAPEKNPVATASSTPKKTTAAKVGASAEKKPSPINLPPSGTGFVKPKPKSPTRPIKLPSSLTTHTAASASKLGKESPGAAPARTSQATTGSQYLNVNPTTHRPASRTSVSTTGTAKKSLKRQSSTINRPRPSLGPPPKQTARDHPVAKKEGGVDDSFLARMMRPTQSSSSKTTEKTAVTPPRKQSAPHTVKKTVPKEAEANAKKAAAKIHAATNKTKEAKESVKPVKGNTPSAKEIATKVAKAETAEGAIQEAKQSQDTATTPVVEKPQHESKPGVEDIAPVVAQETSAEDIIETAKASNDIVPSPEAGKIEGEKAEPAVTEEPTAAIGKSPGPQVIIPFMTEDPHKVEDIEDLVQEPIDEPVAEKQPSPEPALEESKATGADDVNEPGLDDSDSQAHAKEDIAAASENAGNHLEEHKLEDENTDGTQSLEAQMEQMALGGRDGTTEEPIKEADVPATEVA